MTISPPETTQHLARLAQKIRSDPTYMASILAAYQSQERLDDLGLADRLGINVSQLPRLALCKRPQMQGEKFVEQIKQIALYAGTDPVTLAQITRQVETLATLQSMPLVVEQEIETRSATSTSGLLAAARDRVEEPSEPTPDNKLDHEVDQDSSGSE